MFLWQGSTDCVKVSVRAPQVQQLDQLVESAARLDPSF